MMRNKTRRILLVAALLVGAVIPARISKAQTYDLKTDQNALKVGDIVQPGDIIEANPGGFTGTAQHTEYLYFDNNYKNDYNGDDSSKDWHSLIIEKNELNGNTTILDYKLDNFNTNNQVMQIDPADDFAGWRVMDIKTSINASNNDIAIDYIVLRALRKYKITYVLDGGTVSTPNPNSYVETVGVEKFNDAAKTGYTFNGWYDAATGGNKVTSISAEKTGDITLYARFEPKTATLTLDDNGGSGGAVSSTTLTYDADMPQVTALPTRQGYTFEGYYVSDVQYVNTDKAWQTVTGSIEGGKWKSEAATLTLKAKWKEDTTPNTNANKDTNTNTDTTPIITEADLDKINATSSEKDIEGSIFGKLFARSIKYTKNSITLKWKKVAGADGYIIYGNQCDHGKKKYKYQYITTIKNASTTKWKATKLKKDKYYKYYLAAYKEVNGEKQIISTSKTIHATTISPKYGSAQSLTLNKSKTTLKVGKTFKIKAKEKNKSRKIRSHRAISFESSDTSIATVDAKGKVTAVSSGKCKIWVYAQNGLYKTFTVTVK